MKHTVVQPIQQPESNDATPTQQSDAHQPARPGSLRASMTLLVLAAVTLGLAVGQVGFDNLIITAAAAIGLIFGSIGLIAFAQHRVVAPLDRIAEQVEHLTITRRDPQTNDMPIDRDDEVGRIARAIRQFYASCVRDHHDARQLRRTLDSRVQKSTNVAVAKLSKLAMHDPLTNLANRRFLNDQLPAMISSAKSDGQDLVCLLFDMDHFKQVNDQLGHAAGDELLMLLADLLRTTVRDGDLVARLGGDEFVVFMPSANPDIATRLTTRVRELFRQQTRHTISLDPMPNLSAGVSSMKLDGCANSEQLIDMADQRLYEAKRNGRGQTQSTAA